MALPRTLPNKDDNYSPAVSSPLNPTSCYQIHMKQQHLGHRRRRTITIVGRTGGAAARQSPTQLLLRHKAAVAFHDHVVAASQARDRWVALDGSDIGDAGISCGQGAHSKSAAATTAPRVHVGIDGRMLRYPPKISSKSAPRRSSGGCGFPASVGVQMGGDAGTNQQLGPLETDDRDSSSDSDDSDDGDDGGSGDDKMQLTLQVDGSEFLVDFSGVTIDRISTAVLVPQRRAMASSWTTPRSMFLGAAVATLLFIMLVVRLQALFAKYLMP